MNTYISNRLKKALRLGAISFLLPLSSSLFISCEDVPMPFNNPELPPEPEIEVIDPAGDGTKENPYNIAAVIAYINTLGADVQSSKDVYVTGVITNISSEFGTEKGNATFDMSDTDNAVNKFTFYAGLYFGNKKYTNENDLNVKVDDVVVVCGKVVNYKGNTPETASGKAYIVSINGKSVEPQKGPEIGSIDNPKSVTEAVNAINALADNANTVEYYYVKGKITRIKTAEADIAKYTNIDYIISDGSKELTIFRGKNLDNTDFTAAGQINVGDEVIVYGQLKKYINNGTVVPEMDQGNYIVKYTKGDVIPGGEAKGSGSEADPFNVAAAVAKCKEVGETASTDKFYIKGIADGDYTVGSYKNIDVDLVDKEGSSEKFKVFHCKGLDGKDIKEGFKVSKGDAIVVYGPIVNYKGNTPETATGAFIVSINGKAPEADGGSGGGDTPGTAVGSIDNPKTCSEVLTVINGLADGGKTDVDYFVKGKITKIKTTDANIAKFKNIDYIITDGTTEITVFRGKNLNNTDFTEAGQINVGDEVVVLGKLFKYVKDGNMTPEIDQGNYIVKLTKASGGESTPSTGSIDNPKTCSEALTVINGLADGGKTDVDYYVKGKITKIKTTDANIAKFKNIDYIITDGTTEITVFRGKNLNNTDFTEAGQINVGDEVVVLGKLLKYVKDGNMTPEIDQGNYIVKLTKGSGN